MLCVNWEELEGTACYVALLLAHVEGFSLRLRYFFPLGKKELFTLFVLILGNFWCSVVTCAGLRSNLSYFEKGPKNLKVTKSNNK